jgi:hypothetical protein
MGSGDSSEGKTDLRRNVETTVPGSYLCSALGSGSKLKGGELSCLVILFMPVKINGDSWQR